MNVGELCNREVVVIEPGESIPTAANLMLQHHVGCVVVVRRNEKSCVPIGIITDRDIAVRGVAKHGADVARLSVRDIMTSELLLGLQSEPLYDALKQMRSRGVRRLPVVDERQWLVGLLAYDDVVEWVSEELVDLVRLVGRERDREQTHA